MKTKLKLGFFLFVAVLLVASIVVAGMSIPADDDVKTPEKVSRITKTGFGSQEFDKISFIHYAKPDKAKKITKIPFCYKLLGVQWKTLPVDYVINPTNPYGLSNEFIAGAISNSAETWDYSTSGELFSDIDYSTSGDSSNISFFDYDARYGVQDFKNSIVFGDYPQQGVIGVTTIWFTRGKNKQIVEFDILLDTDFYWGDATINPELMDLRNIVIHELGHGVGLGDVYTSSCSEVTMYGYSTEGETKKRTLEQPDIIGLQKMYGI